MIEKHLSLSTLFACGALLMAMQPPYLGQTNTPAAGAAITGYVTDEDTGRPLAGVKILSGSRTATSDSLGNFVLSGLPPGRHRIVPEHPDYVYSRPARLRAPVEPGTWVDAPSTRETQHIELRMVKAGVITGQVFDTRGMPLTGIPVGVHRFAFDADGTKQALPAKGVASGVVRTNDRGEFRIFGLQPAEYLVAAAGGSIAGGFTAAFYPNEADPERASSVSVTAGQVISLPPFVVQAIQTSGVRLRYSETFLPRTQIQVRIGAGGLLIPPRSTEGQTEIVLPGITSGRHEVLVTWKGSPTTMHYGETVLEVMGDSEVLSTLQVKPGLRVIATIRLERATGAAIPVPTVICTLRPVRGVIPPSNCDGSVVPGLYQIDLRSLPEDAYVVSAEIGGQDALAGPVDIRRETDVRVLLNEVGGTIAVTVSDGAGKALPHAAVALVPNAPLNDYGMFYRSGVTDIDGRVTLQGIRPGDYRLFAWSEIEGSAFRNADFRKAHEQRSKALTVTANQHTSVDIVASDTVE